MHVRGAGAGLGAGGWGLGGGLVGDWGWGAGWAGWGGGVTCRGNNFGDEVTQRLQAEWGHLGARQGNDAGFQI